MNDMTDTMDTAGKAAIQLAEHIIANGHSCPFDDQSGIDFENECVGFGEPGCTACLLKHSNRLDQKNHSSDMLGNSLSDLKPGDHILYQNGSRVELGRVKRVDFEACVAYVWYSEGETAARTPFASLIRLQNANVVRNTGLGGQAALDMFQAGS